MADAALLMGDDELAISFRGAKNPKAQVMVLADLNLCAPYEIAKRLEGLGLLVGTGLIPENFSRSFAPTRGARSDAGKRVPHKYQDKRASPSKEPIDEIRAMELFRDGLDDLAMAETLGCPVGRVTSWRKRTRLFRPRGGAHPKKNDVPKEEKMEQPEGSNPAPADGLAADAAGTSTPDTAQLLTVREFLATLTELLTPAAIQAGLIINGTPVASVAELRIRAVGVVPVVEIRTEGALHE